MKAKTHKLVEQILAAIGPVFKQHPEYDTILEAMSLVMARVIQATPEKGNEHLIAEDSSIMVSNALREFLKLEQAYEAEQAAKKAKLDEGIGNFSRFAVVNGAEQPAIEPGSAGDYPDNPNQNLAKTVAPFPNKELPPYTEEELENAPPAGGTVNAIITQGPPVRDNDEYTPREGPYSEP